MWVDPYRLAPDSQVLVGGSALGRYLAPDGTLDSSNDPQSLHEAFTSCRAPTSMITSDGSG